jgi:hypothetical protein
MSRHCKISTGHHFQNGRHNTPQIQDCPISAPFHMWVDYDDLCGIVVAILKMATGRTFSMSGINSGLHNLPTYEMALKLDNVEFLRYCGGHFNFYRSPFSKWPPQYRTNSTLSDFNDISYVGRL